MGLFNLFKKNKLTESELKFNKMWDLWTEEKIESPYAELMTYQSEINNGGHDQYFFNVSNTGDLAKEMSALEQILSEKLKENLRVAYKAYVVTEENEDDDEAVEILDGCDDVFYENEQEINNVLEEYSSKIEL